MNNKLISYGMLLGILCTTSDYLLSSELNTTMNYKEHFSATWSFIEKEGKYFSNKDIDLTAEILKNQEFLSDFISTTIETAEVSKSSKASMYLLTINHNKTKYTIDNLSESFYQTISKKNHIIIFFQIEKVVTSKNAVTGTKNKFIISSLIDKTSTAK